MSAGQACDDLALSDALCAALSMGNEEAAKPIGVLALAALSDPKFAFCRACQGAPKGSLRALKFLRWAPAPMLRSLAADPECFAAALRCADFDACAKLIGEGADPFAPALFSSADLLPQGHDERAPMPALAAWPGFYGGSAVEKLWRAAAERGKFPLPAAAQTLCSVELGRGSRWIAGGWGAAGGEAVRELARMAELCEAFGADASAPAAAALRAFAQADSKSFAAGESLACAFCQACPGIIAKLGPASTLESLFAGWAAWTAEARALSPAKSPKAQALRALVLESAGAQSGQGQALLSMCRLAASSGEFLGPGEPAKAATLACFFPACQSGEPEPADALGAGAGLLKELFDALALEIHSNAGARAALSEYSPGQGLCGRILAFGPLPEPHPRPLGAAARAGGTPAWACACAFEALAQACPGARARLRAAENRLAEQLGQCARSPGGCDPEARSAFFESLDLEQSACAAPKARKAGI